MFILLLKSIRDSKYYFSLSVAFLILYKEIKSENGVRNTVKNCQFRKKVSTGMQEVTFQISAASVQV